MLLLFLCFGKKKKIFFFCVVFLNLIHNFFCFCLFLFVLRGALFVFFFFFFFFFFLYICFSFFPLLFRISVLDFFTHNAGRVANTFIATVLKRAVMPMREDLRLVGEVAPVGAMAARWCQIGLEKVEEGDESGRSGVIELGLNVLHLSTCRVTDDLGEDANNVQRMISMMSTCMWSANM
jgi:hypothetical protein